ncbi:extensin family protein [Pontixanthobacter gangjinensis]|uniref:extensin family protein n=1 Tax=Pontixanthobacter gangjinensis TaxID=1028742 RepID=UPI0038B62282
MFRPFALIALLFALSGCNLLPKGDSGAAKPKIAANGGTMPATPIAQKCLAQLGQTGSRFAAIPDQYYGAGCSTLNAVRLSDLRGDQASFALANLGPVACPTATAFAGWARFGVDRAAQRMLGSPLARIETMGSYNCRNVSGTSRRSAHSNAQAIDISAFILADGRRISVAGDWNNGTQAEREFLKTIHRSACKRFGTVLGPAYNAAHKDHFHLETGDSNFCR